MDIINFSTYRHRNKPQSYRIAAMAQARKRAHVITETAPRDLTKWRKRLEESRCQK